jgi:hypothetical protein
MDSNAILQDVQQLYNVSDRLDSLAERHPAALRTGSSKRLAWLVAISEAAFGVETSREGRHLEVNYEPAARSRHTQESPTF